MTSKILRIKTKNQDIAVIKKGNKYLCLEVSKVRNDKWITVKPHGDEEKGRHLKLEGDETPKEAMKRQWGVDVDRKKKEKTKPSTITKEQKEADTKIYSQKLDNFKNEKKRLVEEYDKAFDSFYKYTKKIREEAKDLTDKEVGEKNAANISRWNITFGKNVDKIKEREGYEEKAKQQEAEKEKLYNNIKQLRKEIAQETYYPITLAGKQRERDMSHSEADNGKSNPFYKKATKEYRENCQTCVVAYEARRRGYDVRAGAYQKGNKSYVLSASAKDAWIDKNTGDVAKADEDFWNAKNYKEMKNLLDDKVKEGERYNISFLWKNKSSNEGHVISVERDKEGVYLYDPQKDEQTRGKDIETYLRKIKTGNTVEFYRVDDKSFNPEFMDDILKGREND